MRLIHDRHPGSARYLLVLLPGALQSPQQLLEAGFGTDAHARLDADLALVDYGSPSFSDFSDGRILQSLRDALAPLSARHQYAKTWLCGISIGATLAGAYADRYPDDVQALYLLAPYPGNHMIVEEIRGAGGPATWEAPESGCDVERGLWRCLQRQATLRDVHLAYGRQDRFVAGLDLMSSMLDARRVRIVDGGHELSTWRVLWRDFLDQIGSRTKCEA